ncbi:hypothetical protein EVAR_32214_1 [Eumeta japonica]|uniref:Uncharacterized protein n=1 Tax=Eumeta variegata TaxID=151549 RepID=A0A4C1VXA9_EUMVA|nr:hypothetical protein EVAR_32214_1 [Eumeta japonica]
MGHFQYKAITARARSKRERTVHVQRLRVGCRDRDGHCGTAPPAARPAPMHYVTGMRSISTYSKRTYLRGARGHEMHGESNSGGCREHGRARARGCVGEARVTARAVYCYIRGNGCSGAAALLLRVPLWPSRHVGRRGRGRRAHAAMLAGRARRVRGPDASALPRRAPLCAASALPRRAAYRVGGDRCARCGLRGSTRTRPRRVPTGLDADRGRPTCGASALTQFAYRLTSFLD